MAAPDTLRTQLEAFAAHLRDPRAVPPPAGVEERRLQVYRDLFVGSVRGLLSGQFPVLRRTLGDAAWAALVQDFYREHRCSTPLYPEVAQEFVAYLLHRTAAGRDDPPWLPELAHYEAAELALEFSEADPTQVPHDPDGDLLAGTPVVSPLAWALAYAWPVHRLSPAFLPVAAPAQPTCLLLRRDPSGRVSFDTITAPTFRLLQRLADDAPAAGREHLHALAAESGTADRATFVAEGAAMLQRLRAEGVLLGTSVRGAEPVSGNLPA